MNILRYLIKKLLRLILLLFTISVLSFTLVSLSPIDPVQAYVGAEMMRIGPEQRQRIAERWGLNDPPVVRYMRWLSSLMRGDLGTSAIYNQPVSQVIRQRFFTSLGLMGTAWVLSGVLGFLLGVLSGARAGSWVDQIIRFYAYLLASTPAFWLALLLLIVFAVFLKWAPVCCATPPGVLPEQVTFAQRLHHLVLPALTLSIIGIANITLHTRQKLITILNSDYILFARAQGENLFGLIWHHGLRNIALPAITLQFASISELFGGSVLAEQVFAYPGLGQATVQAGLRSDVPLLLGIVLFSTLFVFTGNALADILYHLIDPRIRLGVES
ncbi:MAG: ABC transporter permease [Anaerolineales bacterium]|nr:ABC transporter permease [Anaerolineales bacterium]